MDRVKFVDSDAHVVEPDSLWDNYLESKYKGRIKSHLAYERATKPTDPWTINVSVEVDDFPPQPMRRAKNEKEETDPEPLREAVGAEVFTMGVEEYYGKWQERGFDAETYRQVMDLSGIDRMILYPTVGLWSTSSPDMEPEFASAVRRAYNTWLGDFTKDIGGRAYGAASIDLRDPEAAAKEVRRCVTEYGFKSVHLNPSPVPGRRVYDPECDQVWAACAELNVPVGVHPSASNGLDMGMIPYYLPDLRNVQGIVAFSIGSMLCCSAFIMGGVLERHPGLRVAFLEAGAGWASYWPERMMSGINGGNRGLKINGLTKSPQDYFAEQCFIAADQDDPGIPLVAQTVGEQVLLTATDFGHPEGYRYQTASRDFMGVPGVTDEAKKRILWDNGVRAYGF